MGRYARQRKDRWAILPSEGIRDSILRYRNRRQREPRMNLAQKLCGVGLSQALELGVQPKGKACSVNTQVLFGGDVCKF